MAREPKHAGIASVGQHVLQQPTLLMTNLIKFEFKAYIVGSIDLAAPQIRG